ncbi:hypothetical protein GFS24_07555 [Chitinophaga sp. SYP-B3965]|uniref:hypothetical protein n=1 Tax=Chitinophaga sp. SYP-B3965 TaxID=2663120 RepID=UPI001299CC44|nr:hypothetical protein [Chitinophaga sp. SYP-B3965]MRG44964.1 hypothetical protein [Chitinophaga sp. SYP-B3965]
MKFPLLFLIVLFACNTPTAPAAKEKQDDIHLDNFTFLDYNQEGDESLFIVCRKGDTLAMIYNTEEGITYQMGDRIGLVWKDSAYSPAGDPQSSYTAHFVQQHTLVKEGALSRFLKSHPVTFTFVFPDQVTEYAHDIIFKRACYYMANTASQPLRSIVDKQTDSLSINVEEMNKGFLLRFKHTTDSLPQLYINFEELYQLYEYDGVSIRPAS